MLLITFGSDQPKFSPIMSLIKEHFGVGDSSDNDGEYSCDTSPVFVFSDILSTSFDFGHSVDLSNSSVRSLPLVYPDASPQANSDLTYTSPSLSYRSSLSPFSDSSEENDYDSFLSSHKSLTTSHLGNITDLFLPISGTAKYLMSLFPLCIPPVSSRLIESILIKTRFSPFSTISLAACIIDCLSTKFYCEWLNSQPHYLESAHPEIVLLSALTIATKYVNDSFCGLDALLVAFQEALENSNMKAHISKKELIDLERSMLQEIGYDIHRLIGGQGLNFMTYQFQKHGTIYDYTFMNVGLSPYSF